MAKQYTYSVTKKVYKDRLPRSFNSEELQKHQRGGSMTNCKICTNNFQQSPDSLVLCQHKEGFVHLGCCIDNCSWDKKPCTHSVAVYDKL